MLYRCVLAELRTSTVRRVLWVAAMACGSLQSCGCRLCKGTHCCALYEAAGLRTLGETDRVVLSDAMLRPVVPFVAQEAYDVRTDRAGLASCETLGIPLSAGHLRLFEPPEARGSTKSCQGS